MAAIVVVSAHLDDAVLSASVQLTRPGARLVTVCAGLPPVGAVLGDWDRLTDADDAEKRVRERWAEDDAAVSVLGVDDVVRLDFPDGQHLADAAADPRRDIDAMAKALEPLFADAAEIWLPAGIGGHLDHLATRDAGLMAARVTPEVPVRHYADIPYSIGDGWPHDVTYGPDRRVHVLDDEAQRRKVKAMACYRTQIPALDHAGALANGDPAIVGFELSWIRP
jgi:LmbE family N-acetylglucosaminyl deacetylase